MTLLVTISLPWWPRGQKEVLFLAILPQGYCFGIPFLSVIKYLFDKYIKTVVEYSPWQSEFQLQLYCKYLFQSNTSGYFKIYEGVYQGGGGSPPMEAYAHAGTDRVLFLQLLMLQRVSYSQISSRFWRLLKDPIRPSMGACFPGGTAPPPPVNIQQVRGDDHLAATLTLISWHSPYWRIHRRTGPRTLPLPLPWEVKWKGKNMVAMQINCEGVTHQENTSFKSIDCVQQILHELWPENYQRSIKINTMNSRPVLWQSTGGKWWLTHWASLLRWIWSISEYNLWLGTPRNGPLRVDHVTGSVWLGQLDRLGS